MQVSQRTQQVYAFLHALADLGPGEHTRTEISERLRHHSQLLTGNPEKLRLGPEALNRIFKEGIRMGDVASTCKGYHITEQGRRSLHHIKPLVCETAG